MRLIGLSLLALTASASALAQTAAPPDNTSAPSAPALSATDQSQPGEIIVTATKQVRTLRDVPLSVSVTGIDTIEKAQIRDLIDLQSVVPSLKVQQLNAVGQTNFIIRGFGNGNGNDGIESSVGVFIDGVYRSRSFSALDDLPEIDRIEVLRGPQSTLFGKNVSAGAISIITRKPQFDFGMKAEVSVGNYGLIQSRVNVTGPITDHLAVSVFGAIDEREGYLNNVTTSAKINDRNRHAIRGDILWTPTSNLSVRIIGDYNEINEKCCGVVTLCRTAPRPSSLARREPFGLGAPDRLCPPTASTTASTSTPIPPTASRVAASRGRSTLMTRLRDRHIDHRLSPPAERIVPGRRFHQRGHCEQGRAQRRAHLSRRNSASRRTARASSTGWSAASSRSERLFSGRLTTFGRSGYARLYRRTDGPERLAARDGCRASSRLRSCRPAPISPPGRACRTSITCSRRATRSSARRITRSCRADGDGRRRLSERPQGDASPNVVLTDRFSLLNLANVPQLPFLGVPANAFQGLGAVQFFYGNDPDPRAGQHPERERKRRAEGRQDHLYRQGGVRFRRPVNTYVSYATGWKAGAVNLSSDSRPPDANGLGPLRANPRICDGL